MIGQKFTPIATFTTFNIQNAAIDAQYAKDVSHFLSDSGKAFVEKKKQQAEYDGLTGKDAESFVKKALSEELRSERAPELLKDKMGQVATWIRFGISKVDDALPHVVMVQELANYMVEPLKKALGDYKLDIHALHDDDPDYRNPVIHYGNAIFRRDVSEKMKLLDTADLCTGKAKIPESIQAKPDDIERAANKCNGKHAVLAMYAYEDGGSKLNVAVLSQHLAGFWRRGPLEQRVLGRQPGAFEQRNNMSLMSQKLSEHGGIESFSCISGGDFNEDALLQYDDAKTKKINPDYRPYIAEANGFIEAKLISGKVSQEATEPASGTKIDFLHYRPCETASDKQVLLEDMEAFNKAKTEWPENPVSDHLPRHSIFQVNNSE